MDPLPLWKASPVNIIQILKKCADDAFVNSIQTSRRVYNMANQMQKKPGIYTLAYLCVFVYYDRKAKRVLFDVPYVDKEMAGSSSSSVPRKRRMEAIEREVKEEDFWYNIRSKKERPAVIMDDGASSLLLFRRSDREEAFHKRMTAKELGDLLQFFRFEAVSVDINFRGYESVDRDQAKKCRLLVAEEILKVFPFIQANCLSMRKAETEDLFDRTLTAALEHWNLKELRVLNLWSGAPHAYLDKLKFDWHKLEGLEAKCRGEDIESTYRDLITKWQSGQTRLQYFKLQITKSSPTLQGTFQTGPILLKTGTQKDPQEFHYLHSPSNNRWAITLLCKCRNFFFFDVSNCEGCRCQTPFCFDKLMEVVGQRAKYKDVVDWGPIVDGWNEKEGKTVEELGEMIKGVVMTKHPRPRGGRRSE